MGASSPAVTGLLDDANQGKVASGQDDAICEDDELLVAVL
jgi:hypothetical protein